MALVIENGQNVANANSYVSIADADAYHASIGNAAWTGNDAAKSLALIHACKSLEMLYGARFRSMPLTDTQSLLFPQYLFYTRYGQLVEQSSIPKQLKDAQCEIALMYIQGIDIYPDVSEANSIAAKSIKVGEIQTSTTYQSPVQSTQFEGFRKVDLILMPILKSKRTSMTLSL
jgi:hypothetical protein